MITDKELVSTPHYLCNKIRSLQDPYPNAYLQLPGAKLYLRKSTVVHEQPSGTQDITNYHHITSSPQGNLYLRVGNRGVLILEHKYVHEEAPQA